jgi:hypothetical protein
MDHIFKYEHPFVCTDAAVFTISTQESDNYRKLPETSLQILLYQRTADPDKGKWALPGGFLGIDELPEYNISRKLFEKVHVECRYLEQLYTFCDRDRDPRARVISISYLGLLNEAEAAKFDSKEQWFTFTNERDGKILLKNERVVLKKEEIGFDHGHIMEVALERLRSKILYSNIIFNLLPEEFTLTQLQNVYETIMGKKEQAANFRRKIMPMLCETERMIGQKGHRPAKLFTTRQEQK